MTDARITDAPVTDLLEATSPSWLADNVARVRATIADAAARSGRRAEDVQLVAVSKTQPAERVAQVAALGVERFGENRVQEGQAKIPRVRELAGRGLSWDMIGSLQRNKVRPCLGLFGLIQSVDSLALAEAISARAEGRAATILLEVYFGDDPARPGFRPAALLDDAHHVLGLQSIDVRGLMTVAPFGSTADEARGVFRRLRELRDALRARYPSARLDELSMGMTDDYPLAIEEGATIVRVGRAIFGERATR